MADLREALRPTITSPPLPMSEIAVRARRRRRRRRTRMAGLAAALSLGSFAAVDVTRARSDQRVTADGPVSGLDAADQPANAGAADGTGDDESISGGDSGPAPTSATSILELPGPGVGDPDTDRDGAAPGSDAPPSTAAGDPPADTGVSTPGPTTSATTAPSAADLDRPEPTSEVGPPQDTVRSVNDGIRTSFTTTSEWEDGYCLRVRLDNDGATAETWRLALVLDGTIDSFWSATLEPTDDGTFTFTGERDHNTTLQPGAWTSFGLCLNTAGGGSGRGGA